MMSLLSFALRLVFAALFLLGGISKLYNLELTELVVAESKLFSWSLVVIVAKLLASAEIMLGLLVLFNPFARNLAHKISLSVLSLFSVYLLWQIIFRSENEDCGCFPGLMTMSPTIALVRNILLLGLAFYLVKKDERGIFNYAVPFKIWIPVILVMFALPFVLYASSGSDNEEQDYLGKKVPYEIMDNHPKVLERKTKADLNKGKYIVGFVSLTCPNCKLATKRLRILKDMYPSLPIVLVINGDKENFKSFFAYTGAQNFEYIHFNGGEDYARMSGVLLPNIIVTGNGIVKAKLGYNDLNETELGKYFELK